MTAAGVALPPGWSIAPDGTALHGPGGYRIGLTIPRPSALQFIARYLRALEGGPVRVKPSVMAHHWPDPAGALEAMARQVAARETSPNAAGLLLAMSVTSRSLGLTWADVGYAPS